MKISEQWLHEWVEPGLDRAQLSDQLTMLGLEVDAVTPAAPDLDSFLVGRVEAVQPHPNADRLRLCTVDVGAGQPRSIVCGAPNVRQGMAVAVAPVGVSLPDGTEIKAAEIRGQASAGMLCSPAELGLGTDHDGIIELDAAARPGAALAAHLGLPDMVLELDLTPNRGDCLSMLGVAREVAIANDLTVHEPDTQPLVADIDDIIEVAIDAPDLCPGYAARCVFDVDPDAPTPDWLAERLRRAGVRPLWLPVDICNLLMIELGQPMHAFDYDKLRGGLRVRRATAGERLTILDGRDITLEPGTLVIADDDGAVAMAGMIGGANTAVGADTTRIVFESACFTPAAVAGHGRIYSVHTDSSHRYERGVDPQLHARAMERASRLLVTLGGGHAGPVTHRHGDPVWADERHVRLHPDAIEHLLGQAVDAQEVPRILQALGMTVTRENDAWRVVPPSWRYDIAIEQDLIEEVARVHGYDRLLEHSRGTALPEIHTPETQLAEADLLATLRQRGYSEAITYSFVDPQLHERLLPPGPRLDLANPIAEQFTRMRQTLWASLLPAWAYNHRRQHTDVRLYERGLRFQPDEQAEHGIAQIDTLAGVVDGDAYPRHWAGDARSVDFFDVKGDIEALLAMGGHAARFEAAQHPALHPGKSASIHLGDTRIGWLGQLAPYFSKIYKNSNMPYVFELDYEAIRTREPIVYNAISEQPRIRRDLAVVVDEEVPAGHLTATIKALDEPVLRSVGIFDVFRSGNLDSGFKSVALSLIFQDKSSTLTDTTVDAKLQRIIAALESRHNARIRGT